jgi:hypothetical protein
MRRNISRRSAWIAGVTAILLATGLFYTVRQFRSARTPQSAVHGKKQLILAVDGVSWDAFQEAQRRGLFKRFRFSAKHVAPYPSMSHPSWTEIIGTRRVFGNRGNAHTIESRWFDLEEMRIADDPRQVFARQVSPYNYQRAFDYFFNPLIEPLMYLRGEKVFNRELEEAESAILNEFTGDRYVAYFAGPDAMAHTHLDGLWNYLTRLDSTVNRVVDTLSARGEAPDVWMVSDHGNAPGFVEGGRERYLDTFSLDAAIRNAGLVRADTGRLVHDDQVAVVTIALATMVNVYFADLEKRRLLAQSALKEPAVELATWLEVRGSDRYVVILGTNNSEARIRWKNRAYTYESVNGNPLDLPDSLVSSAGATKWIPDAVARNVSANSKYPDALFRIVQSATKQVENAPDLIINLRDGYCYKGDLGQFVRMVRTHGSLSAKSSTGILASNSHQLPEMVRGEEILGIMGITPEQMLSRVAVLKNEDNNVVSTGWLNTGRQDESRQTSFLRRARMISASMDYFAYDVMRSLFRDIRAKTSSKSNSSSVEATKNAIKRADIVGGVKNNVDTLLSLLDSIDVKALPDRVKKAEARAREIPELSSLGDIRSAWKKGEGTSGGGESVRRAAMAMWTVPYFLDDVLNGPEEDSIPDPRDADFAKNWRRSLRPSIAQHPAAVLDDSTLAPKLFDQVFAERKAIRAVQPTVFPLIYNPNLDSVTVVYVPGIYGELFDAEIWSRGMKSVRDRLGARTLSLPIDGRCSSEQNAVQIVNALRADTKRRIDRGYTKPNYLILGYSKGGIDATQALLLAPDVASQVSALVTLATPHKGSPVAERSDVPKEVMQWAVSAPPQPACDTAGASHSLWASTRASFWSLHSKDVAAATRNFSVSFVSDMTSAHPWMKITKRIGEFSEPNDGVVGLSSSRFPDDVHAVNLGTIAGDHISGRLASAFPQDAFLEAIVITVAELGALDPAGRRAWSAEVNQLRSKDRKQSNTSGQVNPFPSSLRPQQPLPGGSTGWKPDATFSATRPIDPGGRVIRMLTPAADPGGFAFRCDQADMLGFRREYEFYYDSSNGGSENEFANGFAIVPSPESPGGRACHLASSGTAIKMTTASFQYRPVDFPQLGMRFKVVKDLTGVDAGKLRKGKNDAAFKLWLVLEDTRPGSGSERYMFGYWWPGRDASGHFAPADSLVEALSSRRNLVFSTLPEAWLITVGAQNQVGKWQTLQRNLAADIHRAFPGVPASAFKVVGITLQSDSDETRGSTEVYFESMTVSRARPRQ